MRRRKTTGGWSARSSTMRAGVSGVTVFDPRRIGEGPIARAWLDYPLPLGFHGHFSPA